MSSRHVVPPPRRADPVRGSSRAAPDGPRLDRCVEPGDWFLDAAERGNPDTTIDSRHPDGRAWSDGNEVRPLPHGVTYFRELLARVEALGPGDLLLFTDWRGDPDERLDGPGTEVARVLAQAARRGVEVRGLLWRSHSDGAQFSAQENRELGLDINDAGGQVLLDMRVRRFGSHHQKLVVIRHRDRPADDVAYLGGIDLSHGRRDDAAHGGDPQAVEMAQVYGDRPPWHDLQVAIRGPAVGDVELVFRERWDDPAAMTRHPVRLAVGVAAGEELLARPLPPQLPDPPPAGPTAVQLLRTYPARRPAFPFARHGERSIARAYEKVLARARCLVYVEDQYLWSVEVAGVFAAALRRSPDLRMIFVIPGFANQDGIFSEAPQYAGREGPLRVLREAGADRIGVYRLENAAGTPVYVHAKTCIVDDTWACIGSDNTNLRSWTNDTELSAAFIDPDSGPGGIHGSTGGALRGALAREHLGHAAMGRDLDDPVDWYEAFHDAAQALDAWHDAGCTGSRPPGHLRAYRQPTQSTLTRLWANPLHRIVFDPDGRPLGLRMRRKF